MPEQDIPPDLEKKPTPEETAEAYNQLKTRADLEAMLSEVEKLQGGKEVLGPDGKPVASDKDRQAAMRAAFDEQRRQKIAELGARLKALADRSEEFASCMSLLREANCLINLAFSEMATMEGVDDELIGFAGEFMQHAVRNDPYDSVDDLIRRLKRNVLTFLNRKKTAFERLASRRKEAILELARLNPRREPVVMTDCLRDLGVGIPKMAMGMVHVLFCDSSLEDMSKEVFSRLQKKGYHSIFLSNADSAIPAKWWEGSCDGEKTLSEALDPVLKGRPKSQILIVSSLDRMLGEEKRKDESPKSRQQALLRIVRWCMDNQVLGLVFSEGTAEGRPWLGRSITLTKGAAHVGGDRVRDEGGQEVDGPGSGGGGQAVEGPGEDQSRSAGKDG